MSPHVKSETDASSDSSRGTRKVRVGKVISTKMTKTIVVQVDRLVRHTKYPRTMRRSSKFMAHDEKSEAKLNDTVRIVETRPYSKLKRWRLINVVQQGNSLESIATSQDLEKSAS